MTRGFANETQTGNTVERYTPPHIFAALGLTFDLDPCAAPRHDYVPAINKYVLPADGLSLPWHGKIWLNPPYGRNMGAWLRRLASHKNGIAFVFARTDTRWWHETVATADIVCFVRGRVNFVNHKTGSGTLPANAPSVLIGWGEDCVEAIRSCNLGMCMEIIRD